MDICEEISEVEIGLANISHKYAKACTFGNQTEELRSDMLLMQAYLDTLERNESRTKALPINFQVDQGQEVKFSALKSQGKNLILDIKDFTKNSCVEYRSCLSDSEVCKIIYHARALAFKYNC